MPDSASANSELASLLQQLQLQPSSVTSSNVDVLLTRISLLTDALRRSPDDQMSKVAERLLLADVSMVAAAIRGDVTATGGRLAAVLEQVQAVLGSSARAGSDVT